MEDILDVVQVVEHTQKLFKHRHVVAFDGRGGLWQELDFVDEEDLDLLPRENVVLVVTGSQGESRAALSRISRGEFKGVSLEKGDTVIFSSRDIPGNEKDINEVKNSLIASGITVINDKSAMSEWGVHSVQVCVQLDKQLTNPSPQIQAKRAKAAPDLVGFKIPDVWVAGYGLDVAGAMRHLPCIVSVNWDG